MRIQNGCGEVEKPKNQQDQLEAKKSGSRPQIQDLKWYWIAKRKKDIWDNTLRSSKACLAGKFKEKCINIKDASATKTTVPENISSTGKLGELWLFYQKNRFPAQKYSSALQAHCKQKVDNFQHGLLKLQIMKQYIKKNFF